MQIEYKNAVPIPIEELTPYERNAKQHDDQQIDNIAESIRRFGFTQPLVIDKDKVVVIGHGRLAAAKRIGLAEVPCIQRDDLTEKQIRELRILDNKLNESPWDVELLATDLQGLDFDGFTLEFEIPEEIEPITAEEDGWEPDLTPEPTIQTGEIWLLGEHRLLCGDSTDPENIKKLVGGVSNIDLLLTDPPYNVSLGQSGGHAIRPSEAKQMKRRTDGKIIQNDYFSDDEEFIGFLIKAFNAALQALKPGGAFYIWFSTSQERNFLQAAAAAGMQIREELIWVKNTLVLGRQDYQWRHEPCLYGWKDGAGHYFADTRRETTVIEDQIDPDKMSKKQLQEYVKALLDEEAVPTTVLHEDKPGRSDLHPTMKPVKLMARLIRNSSREGEIVLDPFGGSGSTLIACEQMRRRCYTAELDRAYAQTIIDRWETFTGKKAVRL